MSDQEQSREISTEVRLAGIPIDVEADPSVESFMGALISRKTFELRLKNKDLVRGNKRQPIFKSDIKDIESDISKSLKRLAISITGQRGIEFVIQMTEKHDDDGKFYTILVVHDANKKLTPGLIQALVMDIASSHARNLE